MMMNNDQTVAVLHQCPKSPPISPQQASYRPSTQWINWSRMTLLDMKFGNCAT